MERLTTANEICEITRELFRNAEYALKSQSRDLVFKTYGEACMAYRLKVITYDEYNELNTMLVRNGMNNPAAELH